MTRLATALWTRVLSALMLFTLSLLSACGGGSSGNETGNLAEAYGASSTVLAAVPSAGGDGGGGSSTTLTVHYRRASGDYAGWQIHTWGAGRDPGWNAGHNPTGSDAFGAIYQVPLNAASGAVGYLFHQGDNKDHGGADQSYTLKTGANEIWRIEGDNTTYTSNPLGAATPDIETLRVHYTRNDARYTDWGVHIWDGSGLNLAGLSAAAQARINNWNDALAFSEFNGYAAGSDEVVFDIPVLNPQADAGRTALEFIIHGKPAGGDPNNKDGRDNNIRVAYAALNITGKVGQIWLVQGDATVYTAKPDLRKVSTRDARAYWLDRSLIQVPDGSVSGTWKLYHSARGQITAEKDGSVGGADGSITLEVFAGSLPVVVAERFRFVGAGVVLQVRTADQARVAELLRSQLVVVQENAEGKVQNATTAQLPGVLDDLYGAAAAVPDLGVKIASGGTGFKLWAPTAQKVSVAVYDREGRASDILPATFDTATGVWSAHSTANLSGKYYRYIVEVFARGVGLVRNLVSDPYSVSLGADSKYSYVADLSSAALKPSGWDSTARPSKVAQPTDVVIYELHVRDFSANDFSVSTVNRGKYLAFTETGSRGMRHLKALSDAGLTDVHLLPVFDLATVPEAGCAAVATGGPPDGQDQQAAVTAVKDSDCFNWGYDPYHFNAPEGSFASTAHDGAARVRELRAMVQALHRIGLRVGMDVVYNHTTASGQNDKSVLDRVVPGYYHRLSATGDVERSTCCDNTATEHRMMAKLMIDSAVLWAKEYKIDSFRFDLMGHQPRAVMEELQAAVNAAAGHHIHLIGEGWNFGEVANNARFRQASQLELNGSGIGTFSDRARDHVRGGSPFDGGESLVKNQGFINGLFYDDNGSGANKTRNDLMWSGDMIKVGLAGSIRSYTLHTHWDVRIPLEQVNYNGQPAGYVASPGEVVNYVENHDNQTLFDINAYRLPTTTSREDRARVQILGAAINSFSQGIAYFHAGIDTLRSKSMDRDSYNSGDWFNRLDWSYQDNYFGVGLPVQEKNGDNWSIIAPLLRNTAIKPTGTEIAWTRDAFRDLLRIRASTTLLRLRSAEDIQSRLTFHNTGPDQVPTVLVGHVDGNGYASANFKELVYLINVDKTAQTLTLDALKGKSFVLHPVHRASAAADRRAQTATYEANTGVFSVPARTAVVFVVE
ncbi:MAG TPA: pullulanase-type alpha-1,6-glucosidase [Burkholderiaceae bacterium]|jgi:pullulanase|nr:pullulanase-type alpha-1,6-glucosidase [Burkholderiaceae bacterium]